MMRTGLEAQLTSLIGRFQVVRDLTRSHGNACVLEVTDANGNHWVAKRHGRVNPWLRELRAYRRWTPALGGHAAVLHSADRTTCTLVLSKLPGTRAPNESASHSRAGQLLRALHTCAPSVPYPDYAADAEGRLDELLRRGSALLDRREIDFARGEVRALRELPAPSSVPCHLDYAPRNWLIDDAHSLRVIDFAGARRQVWVRDLLRMHFSNWWQRPDLRDAFLDGYGHHPTDAETTLLLRSAAITAVNGIVRGAEHDLSHVSEGGRQILARLRTRSP
ncbi:MAG: hypothetical protein H0V13_08785 [Nocardioidaceae bacterium]|nr:hypothetical protein [Nocardioidaceae bacterium]